MTNGPAHEAGETARGVVNALSGQPVLLVLLVFIIVFLGLFAWQANNTREHYEGLYKSMLDNQTKLLEACGPKQ